MTINKVFIVGAGLMGKGIAIDLALRGVPVSLTDRDKERALDAPLEIHEIVEYLRSLGRALPQLPESLIEIAPNLEMASSAQLVIEAITEDRESKLALLAELEPLLQDEAILATNSSSLNITELSVNLSRPERFLGTHFFNPPYLLPLVEIFGGPRTSERCVDQAFTFLQDLGKAPVRVRKEVPGLIANRLQFALLWEALRLVEEGVATAEDIDSVVATSFGRRLASLGPMAVADFGGLHTYLKIFEYLAPTMPWNKIPSELERRVKAGCHGVSTRGGLRNWTDERIREASQRRDRTLILLLELEALAEKDL